MARKDDIKVVSRNKRARHDYEIIDNYEAGVVLKGTEVKSLRQNNTSIQEAYVIIRDGEIFITGWYIAPYKEGNINNVDPTRTRKLLLHKREIERLDAKVRQTGLTLIPLTVYFRDDKVKIEIALARGKKLYDKREDMKRKAQERKMEKLTKESISKYY